MGVINFIDMLYSNNKYRCQKKETSFLMFSTLNYYYKVNFSNRITNNIWLGNNPVQMAKIQLNGNDRFAERVGSYFSLVQPYQHHGIDKGNSDTS